MHRAPTASAPGRRRPRTAAAAGAVTSLCLVLAGCAVSEEPPAASGSSNTYLEGVLSTPSRTSLNPLQADIDFAGQTVRNHRDAVALSEALLAKDEVDAEVRTLAERVRDEHATRIDELIGLLKGWGAEPPAEEGASPSVSYEPEEAAARAAEKATEDMRGGLLTDADRLAMESVSGDAASRVYLLQLHRLYQGTVALAGNELQFGSDDAGKAVAQQIKDGHVQGMQDLQGRLSDMGAIGADVAPKSPASGFTGPIELEGVGADGSVPVDQTPSLLRSAEADVSGYWKSRPSATPSPSPADTARPASPSPSNG